MKHSSLSRTLMGFAALATVAVAGAQTIRRDTVVPIRFEDTIRLSTVRVGDPIRAYADGSRELPSGSVFEGRVRTVRRPSRGENGYVEFEFTTLRLGGRYYGNDRDNRNGDWNRDRDRNRDDRNNGRWNDNGRWETGNGGYGQTYKIRAVPIPLDNRYTSRDRDGKITVRNNPGVSRDTAVFGGGLAGLAIGALIKKPLEGAIVGALGGILVAETNRGGTSDVIIDRNTRMGAAFQSDVRIDGYYDDGGWNRDRDRDDPWSRDRDDRWDSYSPIIKYQNRELRFDGRERPYRLGSTVMLPAAVTARQLGVRFDDRNNRTLTLDGPYGTIRLSRDSSRGTLDDRDINLERPVVERDGILYVPAEAFGRILRDNLYIDGTSSYRRSF